MKTDYQKQAKALRNELLTHHTHSSKEELQSFWERKMGELEELDSEFNEDKLKQLVFSATTIKNKN